MEPQGVVINFLIIEQPLEHKLVLPRLPQQDFWPVRRHTALGLLAVRLVQPCLADLLAPRTQIR